GLFFILTASQGGTIQQFLTPDSTANFFAKIAVSFIGDLTCAAALTTSAFFFNAKKRLSKFMFAVMVIVDAMLVLNPVNTALFNYPLGVKITMANVVTSSTTLLVTSIIVARQRYRPAYYVVAGWTLVNILNLLYIVMLSGLIKVTMFTSTMQATGGVIGVVILSLALAERIKEINREKEIANQKLQKEHAEKEEIIRRVIATQEENIRTLDQKVEEKSRDIRSMLTYIKQGIFTLREDNDTATVDNEYSNHLEEILETAEIAGKTLINLLFNESNLTSDQKSQLNTIIFASYGCPLYVYEANALSLIREFEKKSGQSGTKYLEIDWAPITEADGDTVKKILVTLRDVTSLRQLKQKSFEQQEELFIIGEIVSTSEEDFARFIRITNRFIKENRTIIETAGEKDKGIIKNLFINMHTVKGMARMYGFVKMTECVHDAEQYYALLTNDETESYDRERLIKDIEKVENIIRRYIKISAEKLGRLLTGDRVLIAKSFIQKRVKDLQEIDTHLIPENSKKVIIGAITDFLRFIYVGSTDFFKDIFYNVESLARHLGKEKPALELTVDSFTLTEEASQILRNVFIHIIRNSMDHGIEKAEDRTKSGKPPYGKLTLNTYLSDQGINIRYRDDGRGINVQKLREIGQSRHLLSKEEAKDPYKIVNLIFEDGISTAVSVTDISGRGAGMTAVQNYLEHSGGSITLKLDEPIDVTASHLTFEIQISLPKRYVHNTASAA
ncbi:MAG: Hpt domain-containing protein, partial [Oligoflexales bacterium]|nr:Hpt domain-containing protein [Oligoflexales bacterium]